MKYSEKTNLINIEKQELKYLLDLSIAANVYRHNMKNEEMREMFIRTVDWVDKWYNGNSDGGETPERIIRRYYDKWLSRGGLHLPCEWKGRL